ncbi:isocitrate/isopropylmalate dehydrogenase family protein [Orientia tsutsugamushi str. UT76]|nr:isocitrate/isopropylmalate dehydrogenase family protein [Orientia tsutsugamushi str. UT76]
MKNVIPVTIAYGDGIGPEIMEAVVYVLKEAAVPLRLETIEIGEKLYNKYYTYGITEDTWSQIFRTKALLKGLLLLLRVEDIKA